MNVLTLLINIIDYNLSRIVIRNDIDFLITFTRHIRFNKVLEYKVKSCFQIDIKNILLIKKLIKKIKLRFLIKRIFHISKTTIYNYSLRYKYYRFNID